MRLKLERCDGTLFAYDAQRWDDTTRGWVWAARVVYDHGIEIVRGHLSVEELDTIAAQRGSALQRGCSEIRVEVTFAS